MTALYSRLHCDSRRSGLIKGSSNAAGIVVWSMPISAKKEFSAGANLILCDGSTIIVDGMKQIFAFNRDGQRLWERDKWYPSQIALQDNKIYYISSHAENQLEAVDFQNKIQFQNWRIPGLFENTYPIIFEPIPEGLVMQVWDPGVVEQASSNFIVYKILFESFGYDWCKRYKGQNSRLTPLVSWENKRVVTSLQDEALIFDLDSKNNEPEPLARFPFPLLDATRWTSCGEDGLLYWSGYGENGLEVAATDMAGNEAWRWKTSGSGARLDNPIIPPIITPEAVYILTTANLYALKEGELLWKHFSPTSVFRQATALEDSAVLISAMKGLYKLAPDSSLVFELELEEPLVTAPVIDDQGRIYVASEAVLYAFD